MKTIGLIGGMSWESSAQYYRIINQQVRARLGGVHSAESLMFSVDFGEVERLQHEGDWAALTAQMIDAAQRLERGGADLFLICTNTMHLMADEVAASVSIPLLHIVDPTAEAIKAAGLSRAHLFRLFHGAMQITPALYFNVLRMESAIDALARGTQSITEVSDRLGFAAPSHFTRFFRNNQGVTPTEYRRLKASAELA